MHSNKKHIIVQVLFGVLQGCPGSAFLFNNALDPFLCWADRTLREANRGIIKGCADDLGIALSRLLHLGKLAPICAKSQTLAGLCLTAPKCVLVPLCTFSEDVARAFPSG